VIDVRRAWLVAALITLTVAVAAQQPQQTGQPASPPAAAPAMAPLLPGTVACPAPAPPATLPERSFIAPAGMMLVQVIPTKVAEFEKFLGYVRDALAKTTDATLRAQAKGWKFFRVAELGPNKDVLYAFVIDPAVTCVDYGFGPLLQAAIPDDAKLLEVWELYRTSVRAGNGGTLMNFVPLGAATTTAPGSAPGAQKPANSAPPLDANPNRPPQ
jgi:hypothetical protein